FRPGEASYRGIHGEAGPRRLRGSADYPEAEQGKSASDLGSSHLDVCLCQQNLEVSGPDRQLRTQRRNEEQAEEVRRSLGRILSGTIEAGGMVLAAGCSDRQDYPAGTVRARGSQPVHRLTPKCSGRRNLSAAGEESSQVDL